MTRRQTREAFGKIRLTDREKEQLLDRILSASSGTAPDGKDIAMKRRTMKPILIAAIAAVMILLMGCAWAVMNLDDLVIGQHTHQEGGFVDEAGETIPPTEYTREVISLQGIEGTPNYQAAAEWYAYEQDYITNHWEKIDNFFERPEAYQAYSVGNQEMMDKVDEICEKYGLKLAGEVAWVDTWHDGLMLDILGIERIVKNTVTNVENRGGYFYACGNFKHYVEFTLATPTTNWDAPVGATIFYHDKEYLDTVYWTYDPADCRQWSYICSDGTQVLIVTTGNSAEIMCDREDAFISVGFFTVGYLEDGSEVRMTDGDLELIAEAIDFSMKPQKPDMEAAKKQLEDVTTAYEATKPKRESMDYSEFLKWQIQWRNEEFDNPPTLYYYLLDYDGDGIDDLMLGYEENLTVIWTIRKESGDLDILPKYDHVEANELWLSLDIMPVEEFPFDEY